MKIRIIPRLDIKGPDVVKGIHMEGLRIIGKPHEMAKKYYEQGADEIIAMDIVASLYGRSPDFNVLQSIAEHIFVPLTVGGGVQSVHDIANLLHIGADKVAINTYALKHPQFLREAVEMFGSQCIVLSVEAKKSGEGVWEAYTEGGRERSGKGVVQWVAEALDAGIGEILLSSVDADGTRLSYDIELLKAVSHIADVPVLIHGGASSVQSFAEAIDAGADGLVAASLLHYDDCTIGDIKESLSAAHYPIRLLNV